MPTLHVKVTCDDPETVRRFAEVLGIVVREFNDELDEAPVTANSDDLADMISPDFPLVSPTGVSYGDVDGLATEALLLGAVPGD
jgi:hypothetical protein